VLVTRPVRWDRPQRTASHETKAGTYREHQASMLHHRLLVCCSLLALVACGQGRDPSAPPVEKGSDEAIQTRTETGNAQSQGTTVVTGTTGTTSNTQQTQTYCAIITETVLVCPNPPTKDTSFSYRCFQNISEAECDSRVLPEVQDEGVCWERKREWVSGNKPQPGRCDLYLRMQEGSAVECANPGGPCGMGRTCDDEGICRCPPGAVCPCFASTIGSTRCDGNTVVTSFECVSQDPSPVPDQREDCPSDEVCVSTEFGAFCEEKFAPPGGR
jgi:hypothetical protein